MLYYGYLQANCRACGKTITRVYENGWRTKTEIANEIKRLIREAGGAVTRDNRTYCKECREKLKIRKKNGGN